MSEELLKIKTNAMKASEALNTSMSPDISYFINKIKNCAKEGAKRISTPCISDGQIEALKSLGYIFIKDKWSGDLFCYWESPSIDEVGITFNRIKSAFSL